MKQRFIDVILKVTGASTCIKTETIQGLWSGYGSIDRYSLSGGDWATVVVKHVQFPVQANHPRGWNGDLSHQRKVKSYEVEIEWYKQYAARANSLCRLPQCLGFDQEGSEVLIVMEDLDGAGYPTRLSNVNWVQFSSCVRWLANFHAQYLNIKPEGLWETGTYWHLETRPEELDVLNDLQLKNVADKIDGALKSTKFQTLVHGDAKLANFCFSEDTEKVAAVDFQYVGGGCGMKDLAYFVGSCMGEEDSENLEDQILEVYFEELKRALPDSISYTELKSDWLPMYRMAWADFHRFLKGWSPGHWKINSYSEKVTRQVVNSF